MFMFCIKLLQCNYLTILTNGLSVDKMWTPCPQLS